MGWVKNGAWFPSFLIFDKWMLVRSLQLAALAASVFVGAIHYFELKTLINLFEFVPMEPKLPLISDWISRVSLTYRELAGLDRVLQFAWLAILVTVCANLVVALPELRHRPIIYDPLEDEMSVVDRALHRKLYHAWLCLHFDGSAFIKSKEQPIRREASNIQQSARSLASLIAVNVHKPPAIGYFFLAIVMVLYFSVFSDAGFIDINRKFVYVGYPLLITGMGMLITEAVIYICAAVLSFTNK